ncbi:MAG TPA: sugar phosphate isomerase/epimerase [Bryobacteraceae bacterium]|nr:sugar phosphate isomerase/epimerase [Bryobacteraceae bacterium]
MPSRRDFLQTAALAALSTTARAMQLKAIGVQLYTVRDVLPQKPAETLNAIRAIGYQEVEATWAGYDKLRPMVEASGLKAVSIHIDTAIVSKDDGEMSRAVDQAKNWGFQYLVYPYVNPNERGGADVMKAFAAKLNRFGEKVHAAGMEFAYHNHAFESTPVGDKTLFQILIDNTDKKYVGFELDCFWLAVSGNDPAEFIRKLSGRVHLLHCKDVDRGTERRFNEGVPRTAFKEVGSGILDWPVILHAANSEGVKHYFVEQDQTPGDPLNSLRMSYKYLSTLNF